MDWKVCFRADGTVWTLHHDTIMPVLQALGAVQVERKSQVEWDDKQQGWVVLNAEGTAPLLPAAYSTRKEAIEAEIQYWFGPGLGMTAQSSTA